MGPKCRVAENEHQINIDPRAAGKVSARGQTGRSAYCMRAFSSATFTLHARCRARTYMPWDLGAAVRPLQPPET